MLFQNLVVGFGFSVDSGNVVANGTFTIPLLHCNAGQSYSGQGDVVVKNIPSFGVKNERRVEECDKRDINLHNFQVISLETSR